MLKIGEIVGPHGVRGEVKVLPCTDCPQRFSRLTQVTLRQGQKLQEMQLAGARQHKNCVLLTFTEVATRNQAEGLRNWEIVVPFDEALPLPPDRFYDHQLEGLEVYNINDGAILGVLSAVLHLPANAVYKVEGAGGCLYVPALKAVVLDVDLEARRMGIAPPAGLLE